VTAEFGDSFSVSVMVRLDDGFVAIGNRGLEVPPITLRTSPDGVTWTRNAITGYHDRYIYDAVVFNGQLIAVGNGVYAGPASITDLVR
jgi:hypothetical protein